MKLQTVYARFYKSFNFDHLRKASPKAEPRPWETYNDTWYPYVEVPIDKEITTIVGANESGKSHLLGAIKRAITGEGFSQRDLCRYSPFFTVEEGKDCWPHIGLGWSDVVPEEAEKIRKRLTGGPQTFDHFLMFREGPEILKIYIPDGAGYYSEVVSEGHVTQFGADVLPRPFEIRPDIALPNFVPLAWLLDPSTANSILTSRSVRSSLISSLSAMADDWPNDQTKFTQRAPNYFAAWNSWFGPAGIVQQNSEAVSAESLDLARKLLLRIANIDIAKLQGLSDAIRDGADGHANALASQINDQLAKKLNFPKWWVQDRDFSLRLTPREMDLVFTIRDRTGTEYTFSERSSGLKYFLSYFIQSQSRERKKGRPEILLMDEPDTYLSAEAQQDLLKIFDCFAKPDADVAPIQVIFVTHSPFLIDKNHAERIRVLEKGKGLDGTRVIKSASQNHYEPLRSAFGAFVGETAFIGSCNLLVEGMADQIILAGAARIIRRLPDVSASETLDLNRLVIVPCGSANHVPHMVFLIRGRDADKPPVVALLDTDVSGTEAAKLMRSGDKKLKRLIRPEFVLQLGDLGLLGKNAPAQVEIEDLVPIDLAVAATNAFLEDVTRYRDVQIEPLTTEALKAEHAKGGGVFDAVSRWATSKSLRVEKAAFAKAVVDQCELNHDEKVAKSIDEFLGRMKKLFKAINVQRRNAERESQQERVGARVDRQQILFVRDHPLKATKEEAVVCLENIEHVLDDGIESDAVKAKLIVIKREHGLDEPSVEVVPEYEKFVEKLKTLKDEFAITRLEVS